jgi:hypothetical protein
MIPLLLWRCPICKTDDSLIEVKNIFKPLEVHCDACKTRWKVRREIGVDYWLRIIESPSFPDQVGVEKNTVSWYGQIKAEVNLIPNEESNLQLENDEHLYLVSKNVTLIATANNPLFFDLEPDAAQKELREETQEVGQGRILLTNRRLVWEGKDGRTIPLLLTKLNSVYARFNKALILLYQMHMISLRFSEESLLKWLTYFSKVAEEVYQDSGHKIYTSRY